MKLVNFRCDRCDRDHEEIFLDTAEIPDVFEEKCEVCGGVMKKFNYKCNVHRAYVNDRSLK